MFGCLAIYVEDKIVLILRDNRDHTDDNGVWLATTEEHHQRAGDCGGGFCDVTASLQNRTSEPASHSPVP